MQPFVSRMKIQRTKKGYTLETLGKAVQEPNWKLSLIERGFEPGIDLAEKIAQVLDCQVQDIFPVYPPNRFSKEYIEVLK
jgi:DNA-binding XRE family transcriptional regulator